VPSFRGPPTPSQSSNCFGGFRYYRRLCQLSGDTQRRARHPSNTRGPPGENRSPFERLTEQYDNEEIVCQECGFEDEPGTWDAETDGATIVSHHTCPNCGAERDHRLTVSGPDVAREHVEKR